MTENKIILMENLSSFVSVLLVATSSICAAYGQSVRVLFTKSVDNTVSAITDAVTAVNIEDTICSYINMANTTLEIAVWDNGSTAIVNALNNAYNRGVVVRYISSTNSTNTALSGLNSAIPVLKRQSGLTSNVMHNKFVVVDNAIVLSGSMNYGQGSMFDDYNNFVIIFNQALAQNYVTEFNEMWGGSGAQPNISNSKFGPDKTDNTLHSFNINGINIESYFSPTDGTTAQIINAINSADHTLDFATFTFTNNDLGDAVVAAKNRGVVVRGIIENVNYIGSEYSGLLNDGINVLSHSNIPNDFHHKYCIIDADYPASDPTVVTGSHNWSNSAEDEYDENTLIIHDHLIANQYREEFTKRFTELSPTGINEEEDNAFAILYPNPSKSKVVIHLRNSFDETVYKLLNYSGQVLERSTFNGKDHFIDVDAYPAGIYFIVLEQDVITTKLKFVKE